MGTTVQVTITGYGFTQGMSVSFEGGNGPRPVASNVQLPTDTDGLDLITATVTVPYKKQPSQRPGLGYARGQRLAAQRVHGDALETARLPLAAILREETAVHREHVPGDHRRRRAGEEQHGRRDLVRLGQALQRRDAADALHQLGRFSAAGR